MNVLFLSWDGAGNQPPLFGLAQELAARDHRVTVAGYESQRQRVERLGVEFALLQQADSGYPRTEPPEGWIPALVNTVWACPDQLTDLSELLESDTYQAVVVDCLMFAALTLLEGSATPTFPLVHSAPGAMAAPGSAMDGFLLPAVNRLRSDLGRQPLDRLWDAWAPFPTLCASIAELDAWADQVPDTFDFIGPIIEKAEPSGWHSPWPANDARPLVLVSFSTGKAWGQRDRIERTLTALSDRPYRVLVTTGVTEVEDLTVPDNAALVPYVPHQEILNDVSVTVTHAGHGTVCASLSHGVPLVCLPNLAADQPAMAGRVADLGAGLALDGDSADAAAIRTAVDTAVRDASYAASAQTLATTLGNVDGRGTAATMIETSMTG